jgi:hypothetical protein
MGLAELEASYQGTKYEPNQRGVLQRRITIEWHAALLGWSKRNRVLP